MGEMNTSSEVLAACRTGKSSLLLEAGANVDAQNRWLETPLHAAAYNGHADVVQLLLDAGANALLANDQGKTPLDFGRLGVAKGKTRKEFAKIVAALSPK